VKRLCARAKALSPPVKSVFHVAGVSSDALLPDMTPEHYLEVADCKARGAWFLHEVKGGCCVCVCVCARARMCMGVCIGCAGWVGEQRREGGKQQTAMAYSAHPFGRPPPAHATTHNTTVHQGHAARALRLRLLHRRAHRRARHGLLLLRQRLPGRAHALPPPAGPTRHHLQHGLAVGCGHPQGQPLGAQVPAQGACLWVYGMWDGQAGGASLHATVCPVGAVLMAWCPLSSLRPPHTHRWAWSSCSPSPPSRRWRVAWWWG
jgi:hypothetical protein